MKELFFSLQKNGQDHHEKNINNIYSKNGISINIDINNDLLDKMNSFLVFEKRQLVCLNNDGRYCMHTNNKNDKQYIVKEIKEVSNSSMFDCETNKYNIHFYTNQYKIKTETKDYIPNDSIALFEEIKIYKPYLNSRVKMIIIQTYSIDDINHDHPIHNQMIFNIEDNDNEDDSMILDDIMYFIDMLPYHK